MTEPAHVKGPLGDLVLYLWLLFSTMHWQKAGPTQVCSGTAHTEYISLELSVCIIRVPKDIKKHFPFPDGCSQVEKGLYVFRHFHSSS